jgi:hypothetical protein
MGDFATTIASDHLVWDHSQTVTYTSVKSSQTFSIAGATREVLSNREINGSQGFYEQGDQAWNLGNVSFPSGVLALPGDSLIDATGQKWMILDCALDDLDAVWRCVSRKAR